MLQDGSTFYSQIGRMAVSIVARSFIDKIKFLSIYVFGYAFYSQN
jgi:hypothetical protein